MAKYGKKAQEKVKRAMEEMKDGTLKSGSGKKVTSRKQAIAIGLSEAREEGGKVPKAKKTARKTASKSAPGKKAKKAAPKKAAKRAVKKNVKKRAKKSGESDS